MEGTAQNSGYWFVLREDQGNVIFSSTNNIPTIQNAHVSVVPTETRYIEVQSGPYILPNEDALVERSEDSGQELGKKKKSKEEDTFWDKNKVKILLTLCLVNRNIQKDSLWHEISEILGVTPEECNNKYRHLRRTYLRLLKKKRLGKHVKWIHYGTCEEVFTDLKALPASVLEPWEDAKVRRLLTLYIENLPKFRNPGFLQKDVWRDIANQLGTTGYNCYHKFKNLRRTYWNGLNRNRDTGKMTKWAYHQYFDRIYYNYKPSSKPWDRNKIKQLLEAYDQIAHKFKNPKWQKKELWKDIAMKIGVTPTMCDKKFRNLKQTYVRLKMKANSGRLTTKWRYYNHFETIYSSTSRIIDIDGTPKVVYRPVPSEDYKKELLTFYLQNKHKFRDPMIKNRTLWKQIGAKIDLTAEECDKHFRNLKQTYIRLACKKKQTGKSNSWPYYNLFEQIFEESELMIYDTNEKADMDIVKTEIRRVVEDVHERRDNDRKFETLVQLAQDSNNIQRQRNSILLALLNRK